MGATAVRSGLPGPAGTEPAAPGPPPPRRPAALVVGLAVLAGASALVRRGGRDFSLWVDEGISVGIASSALGDIPAVVGLDGSPPLYYLVLHGWMALFGSSEAAVRALSLVIAVVAVPVAWWAADRLFAGRAGWVAAVLVAFSSYLTVHSREARMYPLVVVLGLVAVAAFVEVFVMGRRRRLAAFVVSLAALLYTHHWGLFVAAGLAAALPVALVAAGADRRRLLADAGMGFGAATALYAPWIPTLLTQVSQTGAPWSRVPGGADALVAIPSVLGSRWAVVILGVALAALAARLAGHRGPAGDRAGDPGHREATVVAALGVVLVATVTFSWASSQFEPAWSARYFGAYLPPLILLGAVALDRAGRPGLFALAVLVAVWTVPSAGPWVSPSAAVPKSNVRELAERLAPVVQPGDVVMATQLEQVPLLRYYLGPGLRYADPSGVVADPTVADWRHALDRMEAARPAEVLAPLVAGLSKGGHVVLACPRLFTDEDDARWYRLMDLHCEAAGAALAGTPGVERVWGPVPSPQSEEAGAAMAVTLYRRTGGPPG